MRESLMKCRTSKLRDAITLALVVSTTTALGTGAAFAQEQASDQQEAASTLDTIVVTGTRLKSQTMTASSPVTEIQKEEFQFAGATIVEDLVNQYPQLSPVFDNLNNNPSLGYSTVDLRGLGAQRTLTLVNGRRIPKGNGETADISIVPSALVNRVDILTGGASAVYGSDAVAGVVNFILDDQFDGVSVNVGYSAYQHKNDNKYIQGLMDAKGFDYPTGNSGFDGISKNIDLAIGGSFGEGGHAVGWATWRKNEALFQGQRDHSSCALTVQGTACGGSGTADPANFYIYGYNGAGDLIFGGYTAPNADGTWIDYGGARPYTYNYAPINYYQRPDTRFTAGANIKYEINEHFQPYLETMFVNRKSSVQIAASGAFFTDVNIDCAFAPIGSLCSDLGIDGEAEDLLVLVAKRNVEGGPRYYNDESTSYSITAGVGGAINDNWSYDTSFTYGRWTRTSAGYNDFLTSRIRDGLLGCPAGSFDGCLPYDVWNDSITPEQAQALQGVSMQNWVTDLMVLNGYVTGDLGFALPAADGEGVKLVAGYEWRKERYSYVADTNFASGNFAGSGSSNPQIDDGFRVEEVFMESNIPILVGSGALNRLDADLGYRYSNYDRYGALNTYKVGLGASFLDNKYKIRAGYNRATRTPNLNELFYPQALNLWAGEDPCAGANPIFTEEQCALTGVPDGAYGSVPSNPAAQYNQLFAGNPNAQPEEADTWTLGFAANPIANLNFSVDYYDIKLEKQIEAVNPRVIIDLCATTGAAEFCDAIHRNPNNGNLYRTNNDYVQSFTENSGNIHIQGIDLNVSYAHNLGPGRLSASFVGNYVLKKEYDQLPGNDLGIYDCAGIISPECQTPEWRHIANLRYSFDRYTVGLRWRYMSALDYESPYTNNPFNSGPLDLDQLLAGKGISAYNYFDLSGSVTLGPAVWTLGVNNIADKEPPMVGGSLVNNGNSIGGYDQAGRYIFTSLSFKF